MDLRAAVVGDLRLLALEGGDEAGVARAEGDGAGEPAVCQSEKKGGRGG